MAITHELLAIIPVASPEVQEMAVNKIKEAIVKAGGEALETKTLGEKQLAYPIKKHRSGVYVLFNLALPPQAVKKISDAFILMPEIVRSMIVKKEPVKASPVPVASAPAPKEKPEPEAKPKEVDLELGL